MASFLFWNLAKRPLEDHVSRLAKAYDVDVVLLAECATDPELFLLALNANSGPYIFPPSESRKVLLFTRLPKSRVIEKHNAFIGGLNVRHLKIGPPPGMLLAVAHFPGKPGWDEEDQLGGAVKLAEEVAFVENKWKTQRTVL